jgi:site-specific DNA recombinase
MKEKPTVAAIYARMSTADQDNDLQLTELRAYAARMGWRTYEYQEKESSVKKRPVFLGMLDDAKAGKVNVILVWRIDRFARSMKDFVMTTLSLAEWRCRLISITESVDTGDSNPFAEFQRGLLALLAAIFAQRLEKF